MFPLSSSMRHINETASSCWKPWCLSNRKCSYSIILRWYFKWLKTKTISIDPWHRLKTTRKKTHRGAFRLFRLVISQNIQIEYRLSTLPYRHKDFLCLQMSCILKKDLGGIKPWQSWLCYNLGQNKMEQQTPIPPKSRMKAREGQKRAIFPSLIWGGGGV